MLILFIMFLCLSAWGFHSVLIEVAKQRPLEPLNSIGNRFAVAPYIRSSTAPKALRQRYVLTAACMPAGLLCLAYLAWNSEPRSDRQVVGMLLCITAAAVIAVDLVRKIIRHGL